MICHSLPSFVLGHRMMSARYCLLLPATACLPACLPATARLPACYCLLLPASTACLPATACLPTQYCLLTCLPAYPLLPAAACSGMEKVDAERMCMAVWQGKREFEVAHGMSLSLADYLHVHLQKKHGTQKGIAEAAYNLVYTLGQHTYDPGVWGREGQSTHMAQVGGKGQHTYGPGACGGGSTRMAQVGGGGAAHVWPRWGGEGHHTYGPGGGGAAHVTWWG